MPLHRRTLHPLRGRDCDDWGGCSSPPSPPSVIFPPVPSPSPAPWVCPPAFLAPSPSPHGAAGGRRDQGGGYHGYGSPPGGGGGGGGDADEHRRRIITLIVVGAAALAFLSLILLGVTVAVRRRRLRRRQRQQALLAPAAPADAVTVNVEDGGNDDPDGGGGGGGVVHHIWYIRTVGLDEAAIDSIAATRYRAGAGFLGAVDCSVCLGEFQDGELVRLLPKCGHVFHVPCIDTWLRAHVNCPLCRSDVLDPAATAAESGGGETNSIPRADPGANTIAAADQAADSPTDAILERPEEEEEAVQEDQEAPPHMEQNRQEQSSSPDPLPQQQHLPCPLPPRNVRRAASMDAAIVSTAADVAALERLPEATAAPEEEHSGGRDRRGGAPGASCLKVSSSGRLSNLGAAERLPRSFFSRHCRARSSVLPL